VFFFFSKEGWILRSSGLSKSGKCSGGEGC